MLGVKIISHTICTFSTHTVLFSLINMGLLHSGVIREWSNHITKTRQHISRTHYQLGNVAKTERVAQEVAKKDEEEKKAAD